MRVVSVGSSENYLGIYWALIIIIIIRIGSRGILLYIRVV